MKFGKAITVCSSFAAALAGMSLIFNGDVTAGFTAFCFSVLEAIYVEIRWGDS